MNVYQAITNQLKTLSGLPAFQEINKTLAIDAGEKWCRGTLIQSESSAGAIGLNGFMIQSGTYQIDIFTPVGAGDDYALADLIRLKFAMGTQLEVDDQLLLVEKCWTDQVRSIDGWLMTSVLIRWFMPEARVNE